MPVLTISMTEKCAKTVKSKKMYWRSVLTKESLFDTISLSHFDAQMKKVHISLVSEVYASESHYTYRCNRYWTIFKFNWPNVYL